MRILFTSPIMEHPASGGPQLRIENSIKALSRISELDIINRDRLATNITNDFFQKYAIEYHLLANSIRKGFFGRVIFLASKSINHFYDIKTAIDADFLIQHIDRRKIDILWFGYGNLSFPLIKRIKSLRPQLKIVCDTDSVWSRFVLRELPYAKGLRKFKIRMSGRKKEAEEKAWVDLCEVTTAVSEIDAQFYRDLAKDKSKIHIFSNVIDVQSYLISEPPPVGFKTPSIYLAGSFGHFNSPMDTAARWILEEVFPLVLKKHPNIHFYIVGRNSELGFAHMNGPNVTVTGRLDSVLPYLCNTSVALVPLKFESGTRFKILEAGVCNVPIVSTTLGAEGIPVVDEEHILIADEPKSFADAILRLLDDKFLANKLAKNCQDLVKEKYSVEALVHEAKSILEYLQLNKFEKSYKP
jgi:glycosyltransferase involved in cell wall biosynthesis